MYTYTHTPIYLHTDSKKRPSAAVVLNKLDAMLTVENPKIQLQAKVASKDPNPCV